MSLLAEIRYAGGDLRLDGKGGIVAKGLSPEMVEAVKANRKAVVSILEFESECGQIYRDSALFAAMDRISIAAKRLRAPIELMKLIDDADEAAYGGADSFNEFLQLNGKTIVDMCICADRRANSIEGYSLRDMAIEVFGLKANERKINAGAFK